MTSAVRVSSCVMSSDSDVIELQTRLAAAELEKNKLADALLVEKKIKLELSEKNDDLNSQLSQQKQLLFESRRRCTSVAFNFISLFKVILRLIYLLSNKLYHFLSIIHHSHHSSVCHSWPKNYLLCRIFQHRWLILFWFVNFYGSIW